MQRSPLLRLVKYVRPYLGILLLGVLGFEGDCLLGWRAGDAILSEL